MIVPEQPSQTSPHTAISTGVVEVPAEDPLTFSYTGRDRANLRDRANPQRLDDVTHMLGQQLRLENFSGQLIQTDVSRPFQGTHAAASPIDVEVCCLSRIKSSGCDAITVVCGSFVQSVAYRQTSGAVAASW